MEEYNQYVTAINTIFDLLEKMKTGWNDIDNKNYIETIEEYKSVVIENAPKFKEKVPESETEALGNDW